MQHSRAKTYVNCDGILRRTEPFTSTVQVGPIPPTTARTSLTVTTTPHSTPGELAARLRRYSSEERNHKRRRLTSNHSPEKKRKARSPSQLTDELSGPNSYLLAIESFATRGSASPDRVVSETANGRLEYRNGTNIDRAQESTSPSPEPEIVAERQVPKVKQTSASKKRKQLQGMKQRAPETEEDLARLGFNGFQDGAGSEVPETQETAPDWHEAEKGHNNQKRSQRAVAEDGEMLIT